MIGESSPYLRAHALNPVDWYPWGAEALERAKREDKPILLSVGYAACHWCHVMERESFANAEIAALMNQHYVCIKVDREERPDLDDIYMAATVAMTGQGGWPMTVFLTPSQKPFFAGTYFPPNDRYGRPGFGTLLTRVAEVWQRDRAGVEAQAQALTRAVTQRIVIHAPGEVPLEVFEALCEELSQHYDPRWGGFGGAPKFPPAQLLRVLLRHHARTGSAPALEMVRGTLTGMKNGGLYDHLGGGFARYSTDERWQVPHFEKMLYENALLTRIYLEAFQVTQEPEYAQVARETLDYAEREMQSTRGGFFSATDADSEGVEGKYFTFTRREVEELLGEHAGTFCAHYDVREEGNWEHTNVLWTPRPLTDTAADLGLSPEALAAQLSEGRARLLAARTKRVPPALDDKILTSWNALMVSAFAEGSRVLQEPRYRAIAERAADDLLTRLRRPDGGLYRTARTEGGKLQGYLEDYAYLASALIDLYEAGADGRYLETALGLTERMLRDFRDPSGAGFFQTAHDHEALIARAKEGQDGALPNANGVAAAVCARLSFHLDREDLRQIAEQTVASFGQWVTRAPRAFASMLLVVDFLAYGPLEVVIVGDPSEVQALLSETGRVFLPSRVLVHGPAEPPSNADFQRFPLLRGKALLAGKAAAYVCRNLTCSPPVGEPASLRALLSPASG